ncbi:MAG TPA: prolyl oligopeptidase family serine peptidase [Candidatus Dormibacteraeota bacterium]|nr:prolyl oligopeptidase family serine peptidase [Candidatus Dormibacteraeota bacterium]
MADRPSRRDGLTIEALVAVESPREFRIHPRERLVAFTADVAGARQILTMPLRGGAPTQITASEKDVSDPQWSPDGRRLAYVRERSIWVVEADGSRCTRVSDHPAGDSAPRWSPDGLRLAFLSRRRGWSQVWLVEAPVPRRGRPPREPRMPDARALTPTTADVESFAWSPDGTRIAVASQRSPDLLTSQIHVVDVATGEERQVAGAGAWETAPAWAPDGSLLFLSDADGWFDVVHLDPALRRRTVLSGADDESRRRDHGEPTGAQGFTPLPAPDGSAVAYVRFADAYVDLLVRPLAPATTGRRRSGRPAKDATPDAWTPAWIVTPWRGIWRAAGWLPDSSAILAVGESEGEPQDLWILPVVGAGGERARPQRVTDSLPVVLRPALGPNAIAGERVVITARDRLRLEGTLWRPAGAGRGDMTRVPAIVYPHGGPTWQAFRRFDPFKQLLIREGFAILDVDFRGSIGYGRSFRLANTDEWGHGDAHDLIDAAHWLQAQPWCDGRLALWGGSYGGYLVLSALVEEPALWRAGIDLYGDSEIAESYRHGDRVGRLDLQRQMGSPDDPGRADLYRRGSPVYRAERIEAPLLILHGRKDKRVVPLMSERMVEALRIEDKLHEVVWYDEEGHGWERRETRRDAYRRTLAFLRRHVLDIVEPERE